jgi:hypothetical protein
MPFLDSTPYVTPIPDLITTWIHIGQALVGSIGALAFIFALAWVALTLRCKTTLRVQDAGNLGNSLAATAGSRDTPRLRCREV